MRKFMILLIVLVTVLTSVAIAQSDDEIPAGENFILLRDDVDGNATAVFWLNTATGEASHVYDNYQFLASYPFGPTQQWSSDGDIFYYVSEGEIFAKAGQDAESIALSHTPRIWEDQIHVSPDGAHIAYLAMDMDQGVSYIHVMDSDGRNARRISGIMFPQVFLGWSPDSQQFSFANDFDGIYVTQIDDLSTCLVYPEIANGMFSPDSDYLMISLFNLSGYLVQIDLETEAISTILGDGMLYRFPEPSPSLVWVAVNNFTESSSEPALYLVNLQTDEERFIYDALSPWSPNLWSSDSQKLLYTSNADIQEAFVYDVTSGETVNITQELYQQNPNAEVDEESFLWSPDGERIAFRTVQDNRAQLYTVDADGENLTALEYGEETFNDKIIFWLP